MAEVIWSKEATQSLLDCQAFIAKDSERRALKWTMEIIEKTKSIELFPQIGKPCFEELMVNMRMLIIGDYNLYYEVKPNKILILYFKHASKEKASN